MTFKEVVNRLYNALYWTEWKAAGFDYKAVHKWQLKQRVPLIHIPEVAQMIGCKPSDIDDYFIGKDHITIDWSKEK